MFIPNEIEDVVSSFEGVVECAVVGMPDKDTGESVKLFYVVDSQHNFNVDELKILLSRQSSSLQVSPSNLRNGKHCRKAMLVKFCEKNCVK